MASDPPTMRFVADLPFDGPPPRAMPIRTAGSPAACRLPSQSPPGLLDALLAVGVCANHTDTGGPHPFTGDRPFTTSPRVTAARRPDHSKRPDCSGDTTWVQTMTWPFLQQYSKSNLVSPMSITVTMPITR